MKAFIVAATGILGRALVPMLRGRGHEVCALVRSLDRAQQTIGNDIELLAAICSMPKRSVACRS